MQKIRRNDKVVVITGKDKGKTGRVIQIFPGPLGGTRGQERALVQGINMVKRHQRRRRQDEPGGIVEKESPVQVSRLMLYCSRCKRGARAGVKVREDGGKIRYCRRCEEEFPAQQ